MIKLYFKQAWRIMKEEKLFSTLYVMGTGLAITLTMVIAIVYYIRMAPVYPEEGRNRTLVVRSASVVSEKVNSYGALSYKILKEWFYPLEGVEAVTGIYGSWASDFIQPDNRGADIPVVVKYTDENFFRVFTFTFLDGKPFSATDRISGIRKAVISNEYACRLFGTSENVVGKHISLNYTDVQIVGILKEGSYFTPVSYAQLYLPYTCADGYDRLINGFLGGFETYIKVKEQVNISHVKEQINELVRKYNISESARLGQVDFQGQPELYWESTLNEDGNGFDKWKVIGKFAVVILALLFVPALNLSGMISHRMECRLPEMGIRKVFGADRAGLLKQVIWENLLLSGIGGLIGLLLAWSLLSLSGYAIFGLFDSYPDVVPEGVNLWYGADMFFAPLVFIAALLFCVVLNLLSALIPAYRSLCRDIIYSLNEKK